MIQIDVRKLLEDIVKRRESRRLMKERERAAKHMKKELDLVPYDDPALNSPYVFNRALIKIRVGDWVTLKSQQSDDKNEIPSAWVVLDISFPKRVLHLKKTSGAETGHGDAKWVAFELVDKVFPKQDRIAHIHAYEDIGDMDAEIADRIWLQGRQNVTDLVVKAMIATHGLASGPEEIEEELVPNLQFSRGTSPEVEPKREDLSCRVSDLPRKVRVATEDEDWEFIELQKGMSKVEKKEEIKLENVSPKNEESNEDKKEEVKKEVKEEVKEEFSTPKVCSPVFATPMSSLEDKKDVELESGSVPKLQLDQSFEEEPLPAEKPKVAKKKVSKPTRTSVREKKPVRRFQAGQK